MQPAVTANCIYHTDAQHDTTRYNTNKTWRQPLRPYKHPLPTHRLLAAPGMLFEPVHCLVGSGRHKRPLAAAVNPTQTQVDFWRAVEGPTQSVLQQRQPKGMLLDTGPCCGGLRSIHTHCECFTNTERRSLTRHAAASGCHRCHNESAAAANSLQLPATTTTSTTTSVRPPHTLMCSRGVAARSNTGCTCCCCVYRWCKHRAAMMYTAAGCRQSECRAPHFAVSCDGSKC